MTQTSFNYAGRYFRFVFGKLRACFVFSVLFAALFLPTLCLSYHEQSTAAQAILLSLAVISAVGLIAVAFVTPMIAMKHLYTKTEADNRLSLPLTARQRYFAELGAILLCSAVPFGAISFPCCAIIQPTYLFVAFHGMSAILIMTVFDVFLMTLCGRRVEAILYPIALNVLIPLVIWFGMHLGMMNIFGCGGYAFSNFTTFSSMRVFRIGLTLMSAISPVGNFLGIIAFEEQWYLAPIASLVFAAVMIPLGLLTYSKRRAENIGRSFVYKPVYTITSVFVAVSAVVCFFWAAENYLRSDGEGKGFFDLIPLSLPVLAVGVLLLLLVMETVNYKRIKSAPKLLLKYAGVLAAGTLVSFALYESEGFGDSAYVPSAGETIYVAVSMTDWSTTAEYAETSMTVFVEADGELAEYFRSVHRELTKDRERGEKYSYYMDGSTIHFTYYLKNGTAVWRSYATDIPEGFRERIVESEEYRYSDLLETDLELCYLHVSGITESYRRLDEIEPVAVRLSNPVIGYQNRVNAGSGCVTVEDVDYGELRAALEADLRNDNAYGRSRNFPIGKLEIGQIEEGVKENLGERMFISYFNTLNYTIYESYTNTLALLSRYDEAPTAEESAELIRSRYAYFTLIRVPVIQKGQDIISFGRYGYYITGTDNEALLTEEQFIEALSHSAAYIRTEPDRDYYYVVVGGAPIAMEKTVDPEDLRTLGKGIFISDEFYDTLDEWYEAGHVTAPPEEETALSVDYACHAR